MSSLGGKNSLGRQSGARSSRASSTIFKKLKNLDRQIGELDRRIEFWCMSWIVSPMQSKMIKRESERRDRLDQKRKLIRKQRKNCTIVQKVKNK